MDLLDQNVHKLFEGIYNFFKEYNIYIKKNLSFLFKKSGCATAHPHLNVAPPLNMNLFLYLFIRRHPFLAIINCMTVICDLFLTVVAFFLPIKWIINPPKTMSDLASSNRFHLWSNFFRTNFSLKYTFLENPCEAFELQRFHQNW